MSAHPAVERPSPDGLYPIGEARLKIHELNQRHETDTHAWRTELAVNYGNRLYRIVYREKATEPLRTSGQNLASGRAPLPDDLPPPETFE